MISVTFVYSEGLKLRDCHSAILTGSWDDQGNPAESFSNRDMTLRAGEDGCPSFWLRVDFSDLAIGQKLRWAVRLRVGTEERWGITEEVNDRASRENVCIFTIPPGSTHLIQQYRLNWSRQMGAQKVILAEGDSRIRFAVWAPNARAVEVVMADFRQSGAASSSIDPGRERALAAIPAALVAGGYISDNGQGVCANWGPFAMQKEAATGIWFTSLDDPGLSSFKKFEHSPYMFKVTRDDGSVRYRTDLYSRCQVGFGAIRPDLEPDKWRQSGLTIDLDGSVSCSAIKDPDYICHNFSEPEYPEQAWDSEDDFWREGDNPGARKRPTDVSDLVIYELHIGALGFGKAGPGTLEDAIHFLDYLEALGINAIELLPMAEFGGGGAGWGYATSHYFAIEYAGGGRDKYKHFIRECHRRGFVVLMDAVFNHYSHQAERAEWMYDSTAQERNIYYWYEGRPDDYADFNSKVGLEAVGQGGYVDNLSTGWAPRYCEPMVRRMFISSLLALVMEFKVDGFRFDQTTSIHAYNVLHANGNPVPDANIFGQKLLREATRALKLVKPDVILIAEDHSNWAAVTLPNEQGGLGFQATWYADFYHHLIGDTDKGADYAKLLKTSGLEDHAPLALSYFAGALEASGRNKVVYHESHDEAGNGKLTDRTIRVAVNGSALFGLTRRYAEARVRLVAGITLLSAGTPMFLFGEEAGMDRPFLYGKVLENREDIVALSKTTGSSLFHYYNALISLRRDETAPALRSPNIEVVYVDNVNRILAFRRWNESQNFLIIASFNNTPFNSPNFRLRSSRLGNETWREIFNSDAAIYGGDNIGNGGQPVIYGNGEITCVIPANALLVFKRT
jgi:1,4-alpha-glucan branching enzyme